MKAWYETYLATDLRVGTMGVVDEVDGDVLDDVDIENQVQALTALVEITSGFCTTCRHGFANWPHNSDETRFELWQLNTLDRAAADRPGCKLCSFFMSQLRWRKDLDIS
ncbi:uncharacterized protein PG998_013570 [Apiospora kogelbergensis]|uniref:Uncharacterized protein n=1 Tax=Apiospora kogelbergensis TaxID=1337665 RepID=A0AAW0R0Z4_9PEZI